MKIAVRYFTKTGNTEKLAASIANALGVEAQTTACPLEEKTDILFLGSSVYAGGIDESVRSFIEENAKNIGCIVNFSTAALLRSTYNQVKKLAEQNGIRIYEEEFHCRGSFKFMHRNRPNEADLKNSEEFAKNIVKSFK